MLLCLDTRRALGPRRKARQLYTGTHKLTRYDNQVDFTWSSSQSPDPTIGVDSFFVRWEGKVRAKKTGTHEFHTISDDGVRLWVNGVLLIDNWTNHAPTEDTGQITLTGGQQYSIKLEYYEGGASAQIKLMWSPPACRLCTPVKETIPGILQT